jgi:aminoglycoside phosphotransferase family enzyme/predicted kinase
LTEPRADATPAQAALARSTRLVDALRQSGPWPHPVQEPIGLVETHISWVLLTGPYAYKLHKPVNLGFLDFTGLEQRLHDCREELRLNLRLSQDLYLGLVAVVDSPAGLRVVEASEEPGSAPLPGGVLPLEVGLRMRQFPQEALLPAALARGAIDGKQLEALALDLARFHQRAAVAPADGAYGTPAAVLQPVRDNITALEPRLPAHAHPLLEQVRRWSERCFADIRPLLEQRLAAGRVRECHGDLHLGNMLLLDGRIQVFDCLEFSPSLRWIDVISDMAFLVMDLEERGAPVLANRLLNAWLGETGDYDGLRLWHWYSSYRAMVRAKVAALSGDIPGALAYLNRAHQASQPGSPRLLLCHGLSGSGKSHLSRQLAGPLGAILLRSDVERKRRFAQQPGMPPAAATDPASDTAPNNSNLYAASVSDALFLEQLPQLAEGLLGVGFSVIVDATFLRAAYRAAMEAVAERCAVPLVILDLQVPRPLLERRISGRQRAGGDPSDADLAVLARQLLCQEPLTAAEQGRSIAIGAEPELDAILAAIRASTLPFAFNGSCQLDD